MRSSSWRCLKVGMCACLSDTLAFSLSDFFFFFYFYSFFITGGILKICASDPKLKATSPSPTYLLPGLASQVDFPVPNCPCAPTRVKECTSEFAKQRQALLVVAINGQVLVCALFCSNCMLTKALMRCFIEA